MKKLLGKLSLRKAVGIYVDDGEIAISQVAASIAGPIEVFRHREKYQPHELPEVLGRILNPLIGKRRSRRRMVAISLPLLRVFFSTRPLRGVNVDVSPKILLHEVLRSPLSNAEEMAVDLMKSSPGKRQVVSLVSCKKRYLSGLMRDLEECELNPHLVEPAPCSLLRAAERKDRAPRRAKNVVRLFLSEEEGLAVLAVNGWPLIPRSFKFTKEGTTATIISIVRTLDTLGRICGTDDPVDSVLIHGGDALESSLDLDAIGQELGAKVQCCDAPSLDKGAIAYGAALGCLKSADNTFDLARMMKPRVSLWDIFPWSDLAVQLVVFVCLALFLTNRQQELSVDLAAVKSETQGRHWLTKMSDQQLDKEKKELELRVDSVRKFLATRVLWTPYTHDLPLRLPGDATINAFHGLCEMEKKGRKDDKALKPKKSIFLRVAAPVAKNGSAPKEIDGFLDSLRGHELLARDFPLVDLVDIKWFQPFIGARPTAFFTVLCLPKPTDKGGKAAGPATEQSHGKG